MEEAPWLLTIAGVAALVFVMLGLTGFDEDNLD